MRTLSENHDQARREHEEGYYFGAQSERQNLLAELKVSFKDDLNQVIQGDQEKDALVLQLYDHFHRVQA